MHVDSTKNQLISLVQKLNSENIGLSLKFHQQTVTKKNMRINGCNGSLWIEPFPDWYDIGLSGQSLIEEMEGFMGATFGAKHGYKQTKPEPHHPYWRVTDFHSVQLVVYHYAGLKLV